MTYRQEFSVKTRQQAWKRAEGICECGCGRAFGKHPKERPHYDHELPAKLGGDNSLENCRVVRIDCHEAKTASEDMPRIQKVRREDNRRRGTARKKKKIPYRRFDGTPVWKD